MTILQFVWQIILICGLVIGLAVGLFSAPWYILGVILVAAFFITWRLMPTQETALSQFVNTFNEFQQAHHPSQQTGKSASATPQIAQSSQPSDADLIQEDSPPSVLSYRGVPYAVKAQSPEQSVDKQPESAPELKYRGARVKLNPPR